MNIIYCNKEQTEKILKMYFSQEPKIVEVSQDVEDQIYFIDARTVPGNLRTFCQFRGKAVFVEVYKGNRRYDLLPQNCPDKLMEYLNKACIRAISEWERGSDIFIEEENGNTKECLEQDSIKTPKKIIDLRTIICIILAILLLLSLLIR